MRLPTPCVKFCGVKILQSITGKGSGMVAALMEAIRKINECLLEQVPEISELF